MLESGRVHARHVVRSPAASMVLALACAALLLVCPERASAARWSIQVAPITSDNLDGVSCVSQRACVAVGTSVERWDGTRWSIEPGANGELFGVDCASATACTAVGSFFDRNGCEKTLAQRWDGLSWTTEPTRHPWRCSGPVSNGVALSTAVRLTDVSCRSGALCLAIGEVDVTGCEVASDTHARPASCGSGSSSVVERWTGKRWAIQSTAPQYSVSGISCLRRACVVVDGGIARFDGKRWSIVSQALGLDAVSCAAASACVAVGWTYSGLANNEVPVAERFNGRKWTIGRPVNPSGSTLTELSAVSCPSSTACIAIGSYNRGSNQLPLAERWNGRRWSLDRIGLPRGATDWRLTGVSCATRLACVAVGNYYTTSAAQRPLIESTILPEPEDNSERKIR